MISLLVVNYRSAALAAEAIRSARETAGESIQVVVVDNSVDAREAEALRPHADVLIASATNRSYGGGNNDGRRACEGDVILLTNPDVTFAPGAIEALRDALDTRTAVAGPALFWDEVHTWHLPPADLHSGREKLDEVLASRARSWSAQRDLRRFRQRAHFWSLTQTTRVRALSGAVMAIRASDFDDAGGFDERFPLYFEETDLLRRLAERHRQIVYVPVARVRHIYNQSAGQEAAAAAARYAESELRYLEKWNGPWAARTLKRLERPRSTGGLPRAQSVASNDVITEASPLENFDTAAGAFGTHENVSDDIWAAYRGETLHLRTVDRATGRVLAMSTRYRT
ncbi:MAG TPA: glycosyltransferase [Thermoanaerobaculia bacterium]|nr:glycosyltransferase [Thermoanaerobaculia bacterium]